MSRRIRAGATGGRARDGRNGADAHGRDGAGRSDAARASAGRSDAARASAGRCDPRRGRADRRRRPALGRARTTLATVAALGVAVALGGCGTKQNVTTASSVKSLSVMLDWFPNADHAPLYAAIDNGYFRTVGLQVNPVTPSETAEPLKLLAAGKVDMAISYEPELLLARDEGLKLVSIAALVQRPLTSIIALPSSHVKSIANLAGKRVGTAGIPYQTAELHTALRQAGVSPSRVTEVNVGFDLVQSMLSGRVAATIGGYWNYEAIQLEQMGKHPLVIPVDEAGVPNYDELVLVVREEEARHDGTELRAFLQALAQGEHAVAAQPAAAAKLIMKANPSLSEKLQVASIEKTLPAAKPTNSKKPFGWQAPSQWAAFGDWMYKEGLLKQNPDKTGLPPFTNEYLPGQGI